MSEKDDVALRVVQLDATELDESFAEILSSQIQKCLKYSFPGRNILEAILNPLVHGASLYYTLWTAKVSVGQALLGVKYVDSNSLQVSAKKIRILTLLRFLQFILRRHSSKLQHPGIKKLEYLSQFLYLCNWLLFIYRGLFPTVALRLLGLKTVYAEKNYQREITFQTLGREILLLAAANSLVHFISFLNIKKIANFVKKKIFSQSDEDLSKNTRECAICKKLPIHPSTSHCQCLVYCYYCVQVKLLSEGKFKCPNCKEFISEVNNLSVQSDEIHAQS